MEIVSFDGCVKVVMEENVEGTSVDVVSGYREVIFVQSVIVSSVVVYLEDSDDTSVVDVMEREKTSVEVISDTHGDVSNEGT